MNIETKYVVALTKLYGMVHPTVVLDIYNKQNDNKIEDLSKVDRGVLFNEHIYFDKGYFVHEALQTMFNFSKYYEQQRIKPFYVPNKEELLKYAGHYFEMNDYYKKLEDFIDDHFEQFRNVVVEYLLYDVHGLIMSEANIEEILRNTQLNQLDELNESEFYELDKILRECINNTRIWFNNGHTLTEVNENKLSASKSVIYDVNEIINNTNPDGECLCGSGKAYKECCIEHENELNEVRAEILIQEKVDKFVEQLIDFVEISCVILNVGIPDEDLINEVAVAFNVLVEEYEILGDAKDRMVTGALIHLLIANIIECINEFRSQYEYTKLEDAFEYIYNTIADNNDDYSYSQSKLYNKSDWNNDETKNRDKKMKYYMNFASDYIRETSSILTSSDDDLKKEKEITEIIEEYVEDLYNVFDNCFGLVEVLSYINLHIDDLVDEDGEF